MNQLSTMARRFLSPPVLLTAIWSIIIVSVLIGPIHYPSQPSMSAFLLIVAGLALFSGAHYGGVWSCECSLRRMPNKSAAPEVLNLAVGAASIVGLVGIGLMAFDRTVLSGVSNSGYAALLRCAPALVDYIEIKRTPLLYLGYLSFSFGFASLALFLLRGEDIKGWAAYLAQLSIVSPVGYALLYSGRMPILFMIALIISVAMVRLAWRLPPLPRGHHLLFKIIMLSVLFGIYTNALWLSRQSFCAGMGSVIQELQMKMKEQRSSSRQSLLTLRADLTEKIEALRKKSDSSEIGTTNAPRTDTDLQRALATIERKIAQLDRPQARIDAAAVSTMIESATPKMASGHATEIGPFLDTMRISWHVVPRQYVFLALEYGYLSPGPLRALLSNYFYLTHGVRTLDVIWQSRSELSPFWGVYEIGVLSPILRVFFPANQLLGRMDDELSKGDIYGFFPTVWGAALIDFGVWGAVFYILMWGGAGGWAYYGTKRSNLVTAPLLLTFTIASIILSPLQGPLGISNSALVLLSMLTVGGAIDLWALRGKRRTHLSA